MKNSAVLGIIAFIMFFSVPVQAKPQNFEISIPSTQKQQRQVQWDLREVQYDFNVLNSEIREGTTRMPNGSNVPTTEVVFLLQAKNFLSFVTGYFAYAYDANGVEIGLVPVTLNPPGSIQSGGKAYLIVPVSLFNDSQSIYSISVRKL